MRKAFQIQADHQLRADVGLGTAFCRPARDKTVGARVERHGCEHVVQDESLHLLQPEQRRLQQSIAPLEFVRPARSIMVQALTSGSALQTFGVGEPEKLVQVDVEQVGERSCIVNRSDRKPLTHHRRRLSDPVARLDVAPALWLCASQPGVRSAEAPRRTPFEFLEGFAHCHKRRELPRGAGRRPRVGLKHLAHQPPHPAVPGIEHETGPIDQSLASPDAGQKGIGQHGSKPLLPAHMSFPLSSLCADDGGRPAPAWRATSCAERGVLPATCCVTTD